MTATTLKEAPGWLPPRRWFAPAWFKWDSQETSPSHRVWTVSQTSQRQTCRWRNKDCCVTGDSLGTSCSSSDEEIKNLWYECPFPSLCLPISRARRSVCRRLFDDLFVHCRSWALVAVALTLTWCCPPQVRDVFEQEGFSRQKRGYRNIDDIEVNMSDPLFTKQWYLVSNQPAICLFAAWPLRPTRILPP